MNLYKIRRDKELSQNEIAERVNCSQNHYSNIENGKRKPSVKVAKKIAEVLDFDWTEFYKE